ncbi:hypothetical protein ACFY1C_19175 [Streptomyces sp. NPDC001279]|uniref:hypothetical protein n=1 Tax=Streptomyces sp. NPDC001279 TaxID=3364556 RepID=UPI0036C6ED4A
MAGWPEKAMPIAARAGRALRTAAMPPMVVRRTGGPVVPQIAEPAQGAQARQEAVLAAAGDDEPRQRGQAPAHRPPGNGEAAAAVVRPGDGVFGIARAEEHTVVHPLGLDELELPPQVGPDEREHQPRSTPSFSRSPSGSGEP